MRADGYETQADVDRERAVADRIGERFNCTLHKTPKFYHVDFVSERNDAVVGFVEVKCRNVSSEKYEAVLISLQKMVSLSALAQATGMPVLVVWEFTDMTKYLRVGPDTNLAWDIKMGGRQDRDDPEDREPVFMIHVDDLIEV